MTFQRGDVILVPIPFTNLRSTKVRPAIILSSETYHASEPDLVLGAITTNLAAATSPVDYVIKDWAEAGLRFPSAFKPLLFTLEPALVIHRVGSLSLQDMAEIGRRLRHALGL
jgi:mRNA interferase MazF